MFPSGDALILALGEYSKAQVPREVRERWIPKLLAMYRTDPDAGIHAALDWLLRPEKDGPKPRPLAWGQRSRLEEIDTAFKIQRRAERAAAAAEQLSSTAFLLDFARAPSWTELADRRPKDRRWFVNGQGQTFTVIDSHDPFLMGSPVSEAGRREEDTLHWQKIGRTYCAANQGNHGGGVRAAF